PRDRLVDVVDSEHDAQIAERVHRCVSVIGDRRRGDESREFEPAVAVRSDHHGNLDALVAQSRDTPGPLTFDHGATFELKTKLGEKIDGRIEGFDHDADVVHSLESHTKSLSVLTGNIYIAHSVS